MFLMHFVLSFFEDFDNRTFFVCFLLFPHLSLFFYEVSFSCILVFCLFGVFVKCLVSLNSSLINSSDVY